MMIVKKHKLKALIRCNQGTSIIELAVILPVLVTIGLGMIEFGNMLYQYHLINVGVRDAARYLAGLEQTAANETSARNIATTGEVSGGTNRVSWWNTSSVSVSHTQLANNDGSGNKIFRGGDTITMVTVSTSVQYQSLGFLGTLNLGNFNLAAQHEERVYGIR